MIEAIVMIPAGFAILYWAFRVSHKGIESPVGGANRKGADKA
jgi:hypothetical protein